MELAQPGLAGDVEQGEQQAAADAVAAPIGQDHEGEFGRSVLGDIFGVAEDFAIAANGQYGDTGGVVELVKTGEECPVRRFAVLKMALVEPFAIHPGKKAADPGAIIRSGATQLNCRHRRCPRLARAHGRSPATNSTLASITAGSCSTRRWPSP